LPLLQTNRLLLRRWKLADREPFARLNRDPAVMEFMPGLLSREESDELVDRVEAYFSKHGFGPWAAELRESGQFIGYIGLMVPGFEAAFTLALRLPGGSPARFGARDWLPRAHARFSKMPSWISRCHRWFRLPCRPTYVRAG